MSEWSSERCQCKHMTNERARLYILPRYYTPKIYVVYSSKNWTSVIHAQQPFVLCSWLVSQACLVFVNYLIGISRINIIVFISSLPKVCIILSIKWNNLMCSGFKCWLVVANVNRTGYASPKLHGSFWQLARLASIPVEGKSSEYLICMKYRIIILIIIISLGQIFYRILQTHHACTHSRHRPPHGLSLFIGAQP